MYGLFNFFRYHSPALSLPSGFKSYSQLLGLLCKYHSKLLQAQEPGQRSDSANHMVSFENLFFFPLL